MKYKAADTFTICFKHQQRMSLSAAAPLEVLVQSSNTLLVQTSFVKNRVESSRDS